MVSRNIAGQTKKATVVAATFISWAAGNAIGTSPISLPNYICFTHTNVSVQAHKSSWTGTHPGTTLPGVYTLHATPA
jgi:hypothetical protein